jgi:hypothetical protein
MLSAGFLSAGFLSAGFLSAALPGRGHRVVRRGRDHRRECLGASGSQVVDEPDERDEHRDRPQDRDLIQEA